MSSFIKLKKLREKNIRLRKKIYLQKQFLLQQKIQFDEFEKFKKELNTTKLDKNKKNAVLKIPTQDDNTNAVLKIPTQDDNTNDIIEKKDEKEEDIDYSRLLSNLDNLYKKIKQGNINLVIDKKASE